MSKNEHKYNNHLKELNEGGYEMVKGEPDIRNWKVMTMQNQEIGRIEELLFDEVSHRVRYLVVHLNGQALNLVSRHVIIPVGLAELRKTENVVLFPELTVGHIASLPDYEKGKITIETERAIRAVFAPKSGVTYQDEDFNEPDKFYDHEHFKGDKIYKPHIETVEEPSVKQEIKENIERVKESVRKMEVDVGKLEKNNP